MPSFCFTWISFSILIGPHQVELADPATQMALLFLVLPNSNNILAFLHHFCLILETIIIDTSDLPDRIWKKFVNITVVI